GHEQHPRNGDHRPLVVSDQRPDERLGPHRLPRRAAESLLRLRCRETRTATSLMFKRLAVSSAVYPCKEISLTIRRCLAGNLASSRSKSCASPSVSPSSSACSVSTMFSMETSGLLPRRRCASTILLRAIAATHGATGVPRTHVLRFMCSASSTSCTTSSSSRPALRARERKAVLRAEASP